MLIPDSPIPMTEQAADHQSPRSTHDSKRSAATCLSCLEPIPDGTSFCPACQRANSDHAHHRGIWSRTSYDAPGTDADPMCREWAKNRRNNGICIDPDPANYFRSR